MAQTVSAKQGPLPGQVAVCRHRTVTPNPVLVNLESFMETSLSAGALVPFWCHMSHIRCQVSGVKCQVSGVRCDKVVELVGGGNVLMGLTLSSS